MTTRRTGFDDKGLGKDDDVNGRKALPRDGDTRAETEADAEEFRELIGDHLSRWDERIEPPVPHLSALEQMVSQHQEELGRRLWRDLLLLWMLGVVLIGGLVLMIRWSIVAFACLQAAALAGALLYLFFHSRRNRSVKRKWTA